MSNSSLEEEPENTVANRDTLNTISTDNNGLFNRGEMDTDMEIPTALLGATFKGKKAFLIKDFISSDRISNRHLNALGIVGYLIEIKIEGFKWKIFKRRKDFGNFHDKLAAEMRKNDKKLGISMPDYKEEEGEAEESMIESMRSH